VRQLGAPHSFTVKPVPNLPEGTDVVAVAAFQQQTAELRRQVAAAGSELGQIGNQLRHMRATLAQTPKADPGLYGRIDSLSARVAELTRRLYGDPARQQLNESDAPSISSRVGSAASTWETRQMPTATQRRDLETATAQFEVLARDLKALVDGDLARLGADLEAAGAPWTPGRQPPR
jgi:chromosome segregation ATPase